MRTQALWRTQKDALPSEMVSLSERLSLMLLVRAAIIVVALSSPLFGIQIDGGGMQQLILLSVGYTVLALGSEGLRRVTGGRGLVLIGLMLLIDGVCLAWITYATGGAQSPLRFLMYGHLIAVTLLASFRTGLKIALWHSLLVFVTFYAQLAGLLIPVEVSEGTTRIAQSPLHQTSVLNLMAFWFIAIATASFSALNERHLRRRGFDLEALAKMAVQMDEVTTARGAAHCLVDVAAETFSFERIGVVVLHEGKLKVVAQRGCGQPTETDLANASAINATKNGSLILNEIKKDEHPAVNAMFPEGKRLVLVPLVVEREWVGALAAECPTKRGTRIDADVIGVIEQFAGFAALAFKNSWLMEEVQRLAETDGLTGVANRLTFDQTLEAEIKRATRSGESVGLLMLDVDHFKSYNDRLGHQVGDDILQTLATGLGEASRDFDTVARYGGEEFALILPGSGPEPSAIAGERLREMIAALDPPEPITASVGVATFPANASDPDGLVRAADEALYESKRAGRNRVTLSDEEDAGERIAG
ncbi:MAG TPA: GGDEF domain-containing protein [Actinomycetota bacterium]|nr:GGDEF domain-containing protein [Actinomycetota bacterium]